AAPKLLEQRDAIFAAAPLLSSVTVTGLSGESGTLELVKELIASGVFDRLDGVFLDNVGRSFERDSEFNPFGWESHADDAVELLARARSLGRLRAFGITGGLTLDGFATLASKHGLDRVERLWLANIYRPPALPFRHLVALEIGGEHWI